MNRRGFFKSIAALSAAIALPAPVFALRAEPVPRTAEELAQWFEQNFLLAGSIIGAHVQFAEFKPDAMHQPTPLQTLNAVTWKAGVRTVVSQEEWHNLGGEKVVENMVGFVEPMLCRYAHQQFAQMLIDQPKAKGSAFWWRVRPEVEAAGYYDWDEELNPEGIDKQYFALDQSKQTIAVPVMLRFRAAFMDLEIDTMEGAPPLQV